MRMGVRNGVMKRDHRPECLLNYVSLYESTCLSAAACLSAGRCVCREWRV